jgi:DNA-binding GntR family transcriptional regulator
MTSPVTRKAGTPAGRVARTGRPDALIDTTDAKVAYRKLRRLILTTELRPGAALNEADLISRIGVGRTPLRDALHLLAHEGLVDILPRRGTFVGQVTVSDLQQIFDVRSGIEDIVATAAAARANEADIADIRALVVLAKRTRGPESDVELDSAFHSLMLRVAGNRYLAEMYQRLADASLRILYLTGCGMEPPEEQVTFFESAESALLVRDGPGLSDLLRDHVRAFRDRVSAALFVDRISASS